MADIHPTFQSCKEVVDYICGHFGEDDDSERCLQLQKHLDKCPDCSSYCNSMDTMIGLYRSTAPGFSEPARNMLLHSLGIDPED